MLLYLKKIEISKHIITNLERILEKSGILKKNQLIKRIAIKVKLTSIAIVDSLRNLHDFHINLSFFN